MKTSEHLADIVKEVLDRLDSKDTELGGQYWMEPSEEPISFFAQNMNRKMFIVDRVFNRDGIEKGKPALDDSGIDLLGYTLLFMWRLRNKGE